MTLEYKQEAKKQSLNFQREILTQKTNAKIFKAKVEELEKDVRDLECKIDKFYNSKDSEKNKEKEEWWDWLIARYKITCEQKRNDQKKMNYYYNKCLGKVKESPGAITDEDIMMAKQVPISVFMPYKHDKEFGNAKWYKCPLHGEKTASFKEYTDQNSYSCFGCNEAGDNISLYMKMNNCDFITAIKQLRNLI